MYLSLCKGSPEGEGTGPYTEIEDIDEQKHSQDYQEIPHLEWLHWHSVSQATLYWYVHIQYHMNVR